MNIVLTGQTWSLEGNRVQCNNVYASWMYFCWFSLTNLHSRQSPVKWFYWPLFYAVYFSALPNRKTQQDQNMHGVSHKLMKTKRNFKRQSDFFSPQQACPALQKSEQWRPTLQTLPLHGTRATCCVQCSSTLRQVVRRAHMTLYQWPPARAC